MSHAVGSALSIATRAVLAICICFSVAASAGTSGHGQEFDAVRSLLQQRMPEMGNIDEIRSSPIPELLEVRVGTDIFYTDAKGRFLLSGQLVDTSGRVNLTEKRIAQLTAIHFSQLPWADSFTVVRGNGKRRLAVFEDPNCGYCKRFEQELEGVSDVTVHIFLFPHSGGRFREAGEGALVPPGPGCRLAIMDAERPGPDRDAGRMRQRRTGPERPVWEGPQAHEHTDSRVC